MKPCPILNSRTIKNIKKLGLIMEKGYVFKRIMYTAFVFVIVVALNFFIPRIGVDDPAERYYPPRLGSMSDEDYEVIKQLTRGQYGFDKPIIMQFGTYVGKLLSGDLGNSFMHGRPKVTDLIAERLPWTLVLSVSNMIISVTLGICYGAFAAWKRGRAPDTVLLSASTVITALPAFFIALMLSMFIGFQLGWLPAYADPYMTTNFNWSLKSIIDVFRNASLPIVSMCIGGIIGYAQHTRNSVIVVSNEDFILTARAKGLSSRRVLYRHTLRNAMLPIVTSLGMSVSGLIGGAVIIEKIFNWNVMGTLFIEANGNNDYPLMLGIMLFMSTFALLANLVTDFTYSLLDPRVKGGR
jgi:peptide/nickel transport system permease protein